MQVNLSARSRTTSTTGKMLHHRLNLVELGRYIWLSLLLIGAGVLAIVVVLAYRGSYVIPIAIGVIVASWIPYMRPWDES